MGNTARAHYYIAVCIAVAATAVEPQEEEEGAPAAEGTVQGPVPCDPAPATTAMQDNPNPNWKVFPLSAADQEELYSYKL